MEHDLILHINIVLVAGCTVFAFIFLVLPLPKSQNLNRFRGSLRYLAFAFFLLVVLKSLDFIFDKPIVNMISIDELVIASIQIPLFTLSLINLINPSLINIRYLIKKFLPLLILIIVYLLSSSLYGDPVILNFKSFLNYVFHPTLVARILFLFYYCFQLGLLIRIYIGIERKSNEQKASDCSVNLKIHFPWIRGFFWAIIVVAVGSLLFCFMTSEFMELIFSILYALFYFVFALFYIQYPKLFLYIEPMLQTNDGAGNKNIVIKQRMHWIDLKEKIITNKYYLRPGVGIDDMAAYLKIGRTKLSGLINKNESINFNTWINTLRVEEAKNQLLANPNYSLQQIAEEVGYSEYSNFCRQFKLITNQSPTQWLQDQKQLNNN
jgi:AraC-like DNA-binding protein